MTSSRFFAFVLLAVTAWAPAARAAQKADAMWGFEIRLGPYQPAVGDQTIAGTDYDEHDYYRVFFGNDSPMMISLEFDRYLTNIFGPLGVFLQVGHWKASGRSRTCEDASGAIIQCTPAEIFNSAAGNDKTQLQIFPLSAGLVYRIDVLKRHLAVPLVGYGKFAFDYWYWRSTGSNATETFSGPSGGGQGRGATMGVHGSAGLALSLDWISGGPVDQHRLFLDSFLFAEVSRLWIDGFGDQKKLDMSATTITFGLSFDFD